MEKLTGNRKTNLAVFISGRGTNLKSIINFSKKKNSIISVKLVISDKVNAKGLIYAKSEKIYSKVINYDKKVNAENKILKLLKLKKINFICLAGFMKILSKNFLKKSKIKILNIHPSLLPKYKGLNTHFRSLKNKDKYSGCTVHLVNEKLDSGKIILQKKIKIDKKETLKSLEKKILKVENKIYPIALLKVIKSNY